MINAELLGKTIAEAVLNEAGPCFYPGKFKPPHKGHYEAARALAAKPYITKVYIIISKKTIDGITPEDSLMIWNMYLQAQPNPKITVRISTQQSPIASIMEFLGKNPTVEPVYVAVGDDESDDAEYGSSLQQQFGDRVKVIKVQERKPDASAPHIRTLLQTGDYEEFKESVPEAAYNRGVAPRIFKMLAPKITTSEPEES